MNIEVNNPIQLVVVLLLLGGGLFTAFQEIESNSQVDAVEIPDPNQTVEPASDNSTNESVDSDRAMKASDGKTRTEIIADKKRKYQKAKPLVDPDGYINTDNVSIQDNIGDKVILLEMWTYSCINCQRVIPYLNEWHEKYSDDGLLIIGNHAPEFEFEKDRSNVKDAVERFNIEYPVVLDNDKQTWDAYNNRYWPQKYIIGVDGFIRYEHIGEGSYNETEQKIRELLKERNERLGIDQPIDTDGVEEKEKTDVNFTKIKTPEIYFGAFRNSQLANGESEVQGTQNFEIPQELEQDKLYLGGEWNIKEKYAVAEEGDEIAVNYEAENVNMVLDGNNTRVKVYHDGEPVSDRAGASINDSTFTVNGEQLYKIIENPSYSRHDLRLEVVEGTLHAYTFTFG